MINIEIIIKRLNMLTTFILFIYGVVTTIVFTVMVIRREYYRHFYLDVAWDQYSLENDTNFFHRMSRILLDIYPFVDQFNKKQGRFTIDRRFRLRFIIWWKLFSPQGQ